MNLPSISACLLVILTPLALAFQKPKASHDLTQVEAAQKLAAKNQQPVAFIICRKNMVVT